MAEAIRLFHQGGLVMYPLILCLLVATTIMIERFSYYRKIHFEVLDLENTLRDSENINDFAEKLLEKKGIPENTYGVVRKIKDRFILQSRLEDLATDISTQLERGLEWLSTIVTMAPLLGLLGTVTGMIRSFQVFGTEQGTPSAITGGVGEALIATATGLCIAIVALSIHAYFSHRMKYTLTRLEKNYGKVLDLYDRGN